MPLRKGIRLQWTSSTTAEHCCVPVCYASSKYNQVLSFHTFPSNEETRRRWIVAIRRENIKISSHTRVCSRHFLKEDLREPGKFKGRRLLKKGAVPRLFDWNNYSAPAARERTQGPAAQNPDHSYALAPDAASVAVNLEKTASFVAEVMRLRKQVEEAALKQRFGIHRFAACDKNIRFFTRFSSYEHLMRFWALIEPSLPLMVRVTNAQIGSTTETTTAATNSLQPIDEMFLFLNYLSLGLKLGDLADRYGIQQSTVRKIITTWSNFLYVVLGSVRIWLPVEKIREHLPAEFMDYADTTVILDCTELRCQCPSSPLLQSDVLSSKSHCTLKGLLGVAPHGAVTFISALFAGSISDKQIVQESGILSLLKPGMPIMTDRGFLIDDFVPCKVYRPAFLSGRSQLSASCDVGETQAIAHLRVHVERLIRRVKDHKFFDTEIPLELFGNINKVYAVACLLTNYENGPFVKSCAKKPV